MLSSHYKFNQILVLNIDGKNLTNFIDADHSISCQISDCNEYELICDSLTIN